MATLKWVVHSISLGVSDFLLIIFIASSVNIDSSVFQNNYASEKGGAIYINRFQDFQIKAKSIFKDNFARIEGSDIYAL